MLVFHEPIPLCLNYKVVLLLFIIYLCEHSEMLTELLKDIKVPGGEALEMLMS